MGLPETKMRLAEINMEVEKNLTKLVDFLKQMGKYKVGISEQEVPATEEVKESATTKKKKAVATKGESVNE